MVSVFPSVKWERRCSPSRAVNSRAHTWRTACRAKELHCGRLCPAPESWPHLCRAVVKQQRPPPQRPAAWTWARTPPLLASVVTSTKWDMKQNGGIVLPSQGGVRTRGLRPGLGGGLLVDMGPALQESLCLGSSLHLSPEAQAHRGGRNPSLACTAWPLQWPGLPRAPPSCPPLWAKGSLASVPWSSIWTMPTIPRPQMETLRPRKGPVKSRWVCFDL